MKTIKLPTFKSKIHISDDKPSKALIILTAVVLFVYFITTYYVDNPTIFLSAFWDNRVTFNSYCLNFFSTPTLPYGLLHQWMCRIWVLPINILNDLFSISYCGWGSFLWYKTFIILFFIFDLYFLKKLAVDCEIEENKIQWMLILFITSLLVAMPVFHIAQTDVIYLLFMILGMRAYLKKQRFRFLLFFAIAIPMKYLPIFVLIPLVLLAEKRFFFIFRDLLIGVSGVVVEKIVCRLGDFFLSLQSAKTTVVQSVEKVAQTADTVVTQASTVETKGSFISHFINKTLFFEFPAVRKGLVASILLVLFFLFCIWCYLQKREDTMEWKKKSIYTVVVGFSLYFLLGTPTPYWIMILFPFLLLMIFMNMDCIRVNLLLQTIFTGSMFYVFIVDTPWVYGGSVTFDYMLLDAVSIIKEKHIYDEGPNVFGYLEKFGLDQFTLYATSAVLASIIGLLVINFYKMKCKENLTEKETNRYLHGFAVLQVGVLIIWYAINLVMVANII